MVTMCCLRSSWNASRWFWFFPSVFICNHTNMACCCIFYNCEIILFRGYKLLWFEYDGDVRGLLHSWILNYTYCCYLSEDIICWHLKFVDCHSQERHVFVEGIKKSFHSKKNSLALREPSKTYHITESMYTNGKQPDIKYVFILYK